jgi:hypothetical protein
MRDPKVEQYLTKQGYRWTYHDVIDFDQITLDMNPARWSAKLDDWRVEAIKKAVVKFGAKLPAIVVAMTHTALYALLSGRHRMEGSKAAGITMIAAYVIDDVLDEFQMEMEPHALNNLEGAHAQYKDKVATAAMLMARYPTRADHQNILDRLGVKPLDVRKYRELSVATDRAVKLNVLPSFRKIADDSVRVAVHEAFPSNDNIFVRAVQSLAFTEAKGGAAKGFLEDVASKRTEADSLKHIEAVDEDHKEHLKRLGAQGVKKPPQTLAAKWRKYCKAKIRVFPESIELLQLGALTKEGVLDILEAAIESRRQDNEVIERCHDLKVQWEKQERTRTRRPDGAGDSAHV